MRRLLATGFVIALASLMLVGCAPKEDDGANIVPVKPPENAPLQPQDMGGPKASANGGTQSAPSNSGQLPPP